MCGCKSQYTGPVKRKNSGLSGKKFSNLTDSQSRQACLEEMDASPTAYGGDFNKCMDSKKTSVTAVVTKGSNIFGNISKALNLFGANQNPYGNQNIFGYPNNSALPYGYNTMPQNQGMSSGTVLGIVGALLLVGTIGYVAFKK